MWKSVMMGALMCHLLVFLSLTSSSCIQEIPNKITVEREKTAKFTFTNGKELVLLYVYHVPKELLDKDIPHRYLMPDDPNMVWWIEGERREGAPITYGTVPVDMREVTPAQPLIEGERYLVSGHHRAGATVGQYFIIRNGIPCGLKGY